MPQYQYRALSHAGGVSAGMIAASDERGALQALRSKQLRVLSIKLSTVVDGPASRAAAAQPTPGVELDDGAVEAALERLGRRAAASRRKKSVTEDDVMRLSTELGVLLTAGLPLDKAMRVQIDATTPGPWREMMEGSLGSLKSGKSFSASLETYPDTFRSFYVNMVRSGEASGNLARVLSDLGEYMERKKALRASVVSALTYPLILLVVATLSVFIMLGFVVPEFEALFDDMGESLPLLTRAIVALGDMVSAWGWTLLTLSLLVAWFLRRWLAQSAGMIWRDRQALTLPLVGRVVVKYEVARFSRTLGTLLHNGVSMLKAVDIAVATVGNSLVRSSLSDLAPTIKRGGRLSLALDTRIFSPVATQMIRVGEESGNLDAMLLELARVHEGDVEIEIKRMLTLLEPALILGMGGVIAVIIMGILMGILSVNTLVV
ncbi:MAG: type II secretion system F family protein [Luminiphilus sp.]|nr:type II secretion system F family protein [Luminiphilus sp.]